MASRNGFAETLSAFALGIGVGAALGVLFAPKSGEETRDYIAQNAKQGMDQAVSKGREWAQRAQQTVSDTADQMKEKFEDGKDAYNSASNS